MCSSPASFRETEFAAKGWKLFTVAECIYIKSEHKLTSIVFDYRKRSRLRESLFFGVHAQRDKALREDHEDFGSQVIDSRDTCPESDCM